MISDNKSGLFDLNEIGRKNPAVSVYNQLNRVKQKLSLAREADEKNFQVLGSDRHQYKVNKPITKKEIDKFQQANKIQLPEEFYLFLTEIGNGGAGPYYGIYKLPMDRSLFHLSQPCKLKTDMTDEEWGTLIYEDDEDADVEETIFTGMLSIGTQGCSYETMLVLNGPYRGRVVYVNFELGKPFFTYESHFLNWYERWLDEVIKGYEISWFGMNMDGDERELIDQFQQSQSKNKQEQALISMHKFPEISDETIDFLEQQAYSNTKELRNVSIQLLLKHDYVKAKPRILQLITSTAEGDRLIGLQYIYWYAKEHFEEWIEEIKNIVTTNKNDQIKRFAGYILEAVNEK
jgi:hypothetical protein